MVELSIIIVNWNTRELLAQCLASIEAHPPDAPYEVWVVDNASADGSAAMVRERFPRVRVIANEENLGFAAASNQAIHRAEGQYILLLNSDTIVPQGSVTRLLGFANAKPRAGIVGVRLLNPDGTFQAAMNDFPRWSRMILQAWGLDRRARRNPYFPSYPPERSEQARKCDWVGGACLLARQAAVSEVGLLDEDYFMYSEEMDWCYRMWQGGWEVWYAPDVEVIHQGGSSAERQSPMQLVRLHASKVRFVRKHNCVAAAWLLRLSYRASFLAKAAVCSIAAWLRRDVGNKRRAAVYLQVALCRDWA